jgi:hypothetical protein
VYFNYTFFAGKHKYQKKWSSCYQEGGFFIAGYIYRTIIGGRKWVEYYGEKVGICGEGIVS